MTRVDPSDPNNLEKQSAIDFTIMSVELFQYVDKLIIDKNKSFAMVRPVFEKGSCKLKSSEHFTLILIMKNIPKAMNKPEVTKELIWNLNKKNGWKKYQDITENEEEFVGLNDKIDKDDFDTSFGIDILEKMLTNIMYRSFGKVTHKF